MSVNRTVHVVIRGRVQGVGFRWFVARKAHECDVAGWVRNACDGSVEVAAVGAAESVDGLLAALRQGPPRAVVQSVEVDERPSSTIDINAEFEII